MTLFQLPVRCDVPAYEFAIDLDGRAYRLGFEFSERSQSWHMHLMDQLANPIVMGVRLLTTLPTVGLLDQFVSPLIPPGKLFCFDTGGQLKDPGRDDFGARVLLLYDQVLDG